MSETIYVKGKFPTSKKELFKRFFTEDFTDISLDILKKDLKEFIKKEIFDGETLYKIKFFDNKIKLYFSVKYDKTKSIHNEILTLLICKYLNEKIIIKELFKIGIDDILSDKNDTKYDFFVQSDNDEITITDIIVDDIKFYKNENVFDIVYSFEYIRNENKKEKLRKFKKINTKKNEFLKSIIYDDDNDNDDDNDDEDKLIEVNKIYGNDEEK